MIKGKTPLPLACLVVAAAMMAIPLAAGAATLSPARAIEIVTIKGEDLGALQGQAFDKFSVMAMKDGKLAPIPYQFDDMNDKGLPYAPGGHLPIDGEEGIIEAQDELVFMLRDAGDEAGGDQLSAPAGKAVAEIKISGDGVTRYAYVYQDNPQRSDKSYTHVDPESGLIKTDAWSLRLSKEYDPVRALVWEDMVINSHSPDQNLLDTLKVRAVAALGFVGATISERNALFPSAITGVKNGPVRSIFVADASVKILGIQILEAGADFVVSRNSLMVPVLATIPGAAAALSSLEFQISLDFHELEGMRVWSAEGPTQPVVAGQTSEDAANQLALTPSNAWLAIDHPGGAEIIANAYFPGEHEPGRVDPLYKDAAMGSDADEPERFPGSHPQVGFVLAEIPTGVDIALGINLYFPEGMIDSGYPGGEVEKVLKPLPVTVTSL